MATPSVFVNVSMSALFAIVPLYATSAGGYAVLIVMLMLVTIMIIMAMTKVTEFGDAPAALAPMRLGKC